MLRNIRDFLTNPARYVRAIEYVLSFATLVWGILLALPSDVFRSAPAWASLRASPASELVWGLFFALLGLLKLAAVWRKWQSIRRWGAFLAMMMWSGVGFSFFVTNPSGPGWSVYLFVLAVLNALTFLRLSQRGVR